MFRFFFSSRSGDILLLIGDISQWTFFETSLEEYLIWTRNRAGLKREWLSGDEFQLINIDIFLYRDRLIFTPSNARDFSVSDLNPQNC